MQTPFRGILSLVRYLTRGFIWCECFYHINFSVAAVVKIKKRHTFTELAIEKFDESSWSERRKKFENIVPWCLDVLNFAEKFVDRPSHTMAVSSYKTDVA